MASFARFWTSRRKSLKTRRRGLHWKMLSCNHFVLSRQSSANLATMQSGFTSGAERGALMPTNGLVFRGVADTGWKTEYVGFKMPVIRQLLTAKEDAPVLSRFLRQ